MNVNHIMFITHDMHGGGCERVIAQFANWFILKGIKVTIVTEYISVPFYELSNNIHIIALNNKNFFKKNNLISSYVKFRKIALELKPDVVISMPEKVNVWAVLSLIGTKIPIVVSERNNPVLYPKSKIKRVLRKLIYPLFPKGFIFQTEEAAKFFSRRIQSKCIILPNPIDFSRIPSKVNSKKNKEIVGVGRLEKQKNFYLLIDAFSIFQRKHNDYKLTIYGEGSMRKDLEAYAKDRLLPNSYSFPGKKYDVLERIKGSSVFVLSSDYEGMPNALIEAMALGLPVIATDCEIGGPRFLINSGENGLLVPVGDAKLMAAYIEKIVSDCEFAHKIGENAFLSSKKLDINIIGSQILSYIERILSI